MYRFVFTTLLIASPAMAVHAADEALQSTQVATLLPPPVEALSDASARPASRFAAKAEVAVPVLKQPLQKGETITADNITLQTIPATQAYASTIKSAEELTGQQAMRPLAAGQPINNLHVRIAPVVSRNQSVTIMFRRGGVELSGRAQAMEDGQIGQSIRVVNPVTRSTLVGVVGQGGVVEVN